MVGKYQVEIPLSPEQIKKVKKAADKDHRPVRVLVKVAVLEYAEKILKKAKSKG